MNALLTLLLLLASPGTSRKDAAPAPADVRGRVEAYLGAIDTPIPPAQWKALGEPAVDVLDGVARSASALPTRRARAVSAAAIIGGARARKLAGDLVAPAAAPAVVRSAAARALAHLAPAAEAVSTLQRVMAQDPSLTVRRAAAEAIAQVSPQACGALRERIQGEPANHRPAYAHALGLCRAPGAKR